MARGHGVGGIGWGTICVSVPDLANAFSKVYFFISNNSNKIFFTHAGVFVLLQTALITGFAIENAYILKRYRLSSKIKKRTSENAEGSHSICLGPFVNVVKGPPSHLCIQETVFFVVIGPLS